LVYQENILNDYLFFKKLWQRHKAQKRLQKKE